MNRKSFYIPVGWPTLASSPHHEPICTVLLDSNTLVLQVTSKIEPPFEIARVPGSWSKHVPEKRPRYRVYMPDNSHGSNNPFTLEPVRLSLVSSGREILVPLIARRPQTCFVHGDKYHGIFFNRDGNVPYTFCGRSDHVYQSDRAAMIAKNYVTGTIPTCTTCLEYRAVWCLFSVYNYEDKREVLKRVSKEKSAEERKLRLPTAYARILDDDLFENPSYKPASKKAAVVLSEIEERRPDAEDEYDDPRESKRATAIDRSRRLEESKAQAQGYRRR